MRTTFIKRFILITLLLGCVLGTFFYWWTHRFLIGTDDAYVNANIVQISPRITGQVISVDVMNNQYVKENQLLFALDPVPFQLAANEIQAKLKKDQAQLTIAQLTAQRMLKLVRQKVASRQTGDTAQANLNEALAAIQLTQANLARTLLDMQYAKISAPTSGWVTNLNLRAGNVVSGNHPVFALISDKEFWIDANFKETDLRKVAPGQKADIHIDMYPKHKFNGVVESISSGTGSAFSLLPPQNASGNWVKITQRIPVRVRVTEFDPHYPLRVGASATVTLHIE